MAHHETNHSTTLAISLVLVFLLAVGLTVLFRMGSTPQDPNDTMLGVPALNISVARLSKERSAIVLPRATPAELEAFFKQVREINRLQFGEHDEKTLEDASILLMEALNDLAVAQGSYHFLLATSDPLVHECQNAIEPVLRALQGKSLTWIDATTNPPPAFESYRVACGNVLPILDSLKIVTQEGMWTDPKHGPALFSILNRFRIASLAHDRIPSAQQLTPYERETLYAWRFGSPALSLVEKERFVEAAAFDIPKFPRDEWLGRIYFDAGKLHEANEAYGRACALRKSDASLQTKCRLIQEHLTPKQASAEKK